MSEQGLYVNGKIITNIYLIIEAKKAVVLGNHTTDSLTLIGSFQGCQTENLQLNYVQS